MNVRTEIDDQAILEILRSTRARIQSSRALRAELQQTIVRTHELIEDSFALLNEGKDAAVLNFYRSSTDPVLNTTASD